MLKIKLPLVIERITTIPFEGFDQLKKESQSDGFNFLVRLEAEWNTEKNRFDKEGERLYSLFTDYKLVGVGGVNRSPWPRNNHSIGRLRRFYIAKAYRRHGFGKVLLDHIMKDAKLYFNTLQLKTDSLIAAKFYERFGFNPIDEDPTSTHEIKLFDYQ